jgi:hypothetical protein
MGFTSAHINAAGSARGDAARPPSAPSVMVSNKSAASFCRGATGRETRLRSSTAAPKKRRTGLLRRPARRFFRTGAVVALFLKIRKYQSCCIFLTPIPKPNARSAFRFSPGLSVGMRASELLPIFEDSADASVSAWTAGAAASARTERVGLTARTVGWPASVSTTDRGASARPWTTTAKGN